MPDKKSTKATYPVPRPLQLSLTLSEVEVLFDILDEIIDHYQWDPGLVAYTRSTTDFTSSFSNEQFVNIVSIRHNLV